MAVKIKKSPNRVTVRVKPTAATTTQAAGSAQPTLAGIEQAYLMIGLGDRLRLFNYLNLSYHGGTAYKEGTDCAGLPILIEHENEVASIGTASVYNNLVQGVKNKDQAKRDRYYRRRRVASYENLFKPIIDKVAAYLVRNEPNREETKADEFKRLRITEWIDKLVLEGVRLTEAWIGFDEAYLPDKEDGALYTKQEIAELDPEHKGQKYLLMVNPACVVDFDQAEDSRITRVVFEETSTMKLGFTAKPAISVRYKQWTDTEWVIYDRVSDNSSESGLEQLILPTDGTVKVRRVESGQHTFGVCPWYRFSPSFPTVDLAELGRSLFNITSLLDEELYKITFTQVTITGAKIEDIAKMAERGVGNTLVVEASNAKIGTIGAMAEQARNLMARCDQIREAMFTMVSMENNTKNVAEAAEKKKRDMEALYTMLIRIVNDLECLENRILVDMGVIDSEKDESHTTYDRNFDVNSIQDLLDNIEAVKTVPMIPPSYKRKLALALLQKMDPFDNYEQYRDEIAQMIDTSPEVTEAVVSLVTNGMAVGEIVANILGVPEGKVQEFIAGMEQHQESALFGGAADDMETDQPDNGTPGTSGTGKPPAGGSGKGTKRGTSAGKGKAAKVPK